MVITSQGISPRLLMASMVASACIVHPSDITIPENQSGTEDSLGTTANVAAAEPEEMTLDECKMMAEQLGITLTDTDRH